MNAIDKSDFSTKRLPGGQRFDIWRESIAALFDITPTIRTRMDGFNASLTSYLLNDQIMFSRCETAAQKFERGPLRPANDGLDHYLIQSHLRGGQAVRSGSRQGEAEPGDILIIDLAERHEATTSDFEHLSLVVPRSLLAPFLKRPDSQEGRVLKRGSALADIAAAHLRMIATKANSLSRDEATLMIEPTLALMASALNGDTRNIENGAASIAASLMQRAKAKIERNLHLNDLSITTICGAIGLSRASLYRLFEHHGGVRAYIQERRLRRAAEDLTSLALAHRYIYDIAFNWGFSSEAHFSRAFKARFGLSPKQARDMGRAGLRLNSAIANPTQVGDRDYETWLSQVLPSVS